MLLHKLYTGPQGEQHEETGQTPPRGTEPDLRRELGLPGTYTGLPANFCRTRFGGTRKMARIRRALTAVAGCSTVTSHKNPRSPYIATTRADYACEDWFSKAQPSTRKYARVIKGCLGITRMPAFSPVLTCLRRETLGKRQRLVLGRE